MNGKYDDIIGLSRPVSLRHSPMSLENRAAQFSPFAALTGYEAAIQETARLTDNLVELGEDRKAEIDTKLQLLSASLGEEPEVSITSFVPDKKKSGGSYVKTIGRLRRIDGYENSLILTDGSRIKIDTVMDIESPLFI